MPGPAELVGSWPTKVAASGRARRFDAVDLDGRVEEHLSRFADVEFRNEPSRDAGDLTVGAGQGADQPVPAVEESVGPEDPGACSVFAESGMRSIETITVESKRHR